MCFKNVVFHTGISIFSALTRSQGTPKCTVPVKSAEQKRFQKVREREASKGHFR